jgi:hypothetical protein
MGTLLCLYNVPQGIPGVLCHVCNVPQGIPGVLYHVYIMYDKESLGYSVMSIYKVPQKSAVSIYM